METATEVLVAWMAASTAVGATVGIRVGVSVGAAVAVITIRVEPAAVGAGLFPEIARICGKMVMAATAIVTMPVIIDPRTTGLDRGLDDLSAGGVESDCC